MTHTSNKKITWLAAVLVTILTVVSAYFIYTRTIAGAEFVRNTTRFALAEAAVIFLWFFAALYFFNERLTTGAILIITTYMILWVHRIALPVCISGLYAAYLCILGGMFRKIFKLKSSGYRLLDVIRAFLTGASLQIIITAIPAALGFGGVALLRIISIGFGIVAVIAYVLMCYYRGEFFAYEALPSDREMDEEKKHRLYICLAFSLMCTMVLMQAARINVTLDYDSLHYGLRSQYVVDNGRGFFEKLGAVNDVYVYPKGLEILLLPICSDITYGYVLSFSLWMGIGVLALTYFIVCQIATRREGLYAAAVVSVIPAVMNLAISAKTDIITLFIQMIAIAELVLYDRERKTLPVYGLAAIIFSYTLKPTSFMFSTVILIAGAVYLLNKRHSDKKRNLYTEELSGRSNTVSVCDRTWFVVIPALLALIAVCARTMIIAGQPVASVGSSVWNALGLQESYPFAATETLQEGAELLDIKLFIKRCIGVFLCPVGDEMGHVIIAWGSLIPFIAIVITFIRTIAERKITLLRILLGAVILATAVCLIIIEQVDGNYFMLLYVLTVLCFFERTQPILKRDTGEPAATEITKVYIKETETASSSGCGSAMSMTILVPAIVLAVLMSLSTSWAGKAGVTTPSLAHLGFYDHESDNYNAMSAKGAREIYDYLDHNPRYRVLAISAQPECEAFRCNVQSYTDLEGSGGNVYLVKKLGYFKEYLDYAKMDYIYVDEEYLETRPRAVEITGWMIEDGSLIPVVECEGHTLYQYISGK